MGIAKLGAASGDRSAADGLSNRTDSCVGVQHHRAGRSGNTNAGGAPIASAPEHSHACNDRRGHFRRCRVLPPAARLSPQVRQVNRSVAV